MLPVVATAGAATAAVALAVRPNRASCLEYKNNLDLSAHGWPSNYPSNTVTLDRGDGAKVHIVATPFLSRGVATGEAEAVSLPHTIRFPVVSASLPCHTCRRPGPCAACATRRAPLPFRGRVCARASLSRPWRPSARPCAARCLPFLAACPPRTRLGPPRGLRAVCGAAGGVGRPRAAALAVVAARFFLRRAREAQNLARPALAPLPLLTSSAAAPAASLQLIKGTSPSTVILQLDDSRADVLEDDAIIDTTNGTRSRRARSARGAPSDAVPLPHAPQTRSGRTTPSSGSARTWPSSSASASPSTPT